MSGGCGGWEGEEGEAEGLRLKLETICGTNCAKTRSKSCNNPTLVDAILAGIIWFYFNLSFKINFLFPLYS